MAQKTELKLIINNKDVQNTFVEFSSEQILKNIFLHREPLSYVIEGKLEHKVDILLILD